MPKGRIHIVFFLGILLGSVVIIVAGIFLRANVSSVAHAWAGDTRELPFICLSNCRIVGPSDTNGPGFGNRFAGKDLSGAYIGDFSSSGGNDFSQVILRNAYLPDFSSSQGDIWHGADFSHAWMENAELLSDFTDANFSGADLSGAELNGNFTNANFSGANLANASLINGTFAHANFDGVHWSSTTCPDGTTVNTACNLTPPVTP